MMELPTDSGAMCWRRNSCNRISGRRLPEDFGLARRCTMQDRAVLGDDVIEEARLGEDFEQRAQLAAGHQDQLAAGRGQLAQRVDATLVATSVASQRSIETCGQHHISHRVASSRYRGSRSRQPR